MFGIVLSLPQLVNMNKFLSIKVKFTGLLVILIAGFALMGIQPCLAQDSLWKARLHGFAAIQGETFTDSIYQFYIALRDEDNGQSTMEKANDVYNLTLEKDGLAHIWSLVYRAERSNPPQTALFDQAYRQAEKYGGNSEMRLVDLYRVYFYLGRKQYDLAMKYILRYRDMTTPGLIDEEDRNIINLLGDMYYNAGLYDQAREVYFSLYQQYKEAENWDFYRPYVLMNNLGQIALINGNLKEAKQWFTISLDLAEQHLHQSCRHNSITFIKIKLAETALKADSLEAAQHLLDEVDPYMETSIFNDIKQELIFVKARLKLKQGRANEAAGLARQLMPNDSIKFSTYRFTPGIYCLFADISSRQGKPLLAVQFYAKFNQATDSLREQEHLNRSMVMLADSNHELIQIELDKSKQKGILLSIGLTALFVIVIVILMLYRQLYKSKLELVRKSLEKDIAYEKLNNKNGNRNGVSPINDEEPKKQKQLVESLKKWMEVQKPFLDPKLTILEVAKQLGTNRTYLSKAINNELKTTFPQFINEYRIREAIRLITSGYIHDHTQEALSVKVGFAGRNVFIRAFKKYTGVVPSFFVANYKRWDMKGKRFSEDE